MNNSRVGYWFLMAIAIALGAFLRLYLIADQILINDEWHDLYYVIGKPFGYLLTHFAIPGATCIPLHLYDYALLRTIGWSEMWLRLPSLAAGLLTLICFPLLVGGILSRRAKAIFTFLVAISPFLVFYSRVCRPYSATVLLAFSCMFSAYRWAVSGRYRYAALFVITGSLAAWFHLFAVVVIVAPGLCLFAMKCVGSRPDRARIIPTYTSLFLVFLVAAALVCALILPALIDSSGTSLRTVVQAGHITQESLWRFVFLVAGTWNAALIVIFIGLFLAGICVLAGRDRLLAGIITLTFLLYLLALGISKPHSAQAAIVLARYAIPLFPLSLLLVAVGLDGLMAKVAGLTPIAGRKGPAMGGSPPCNRIEAQWLRGVLCNAAVAFFLVALLWTGPMRQTYASPNNFTNHTAFQESYKPIDWKESSGSEITPADFTLDTKVGEEEVSAFYRRLAERPGTQAIVECPMMIGDHANPHYFYQHFHGKRVVIGYCTDYPNPSAFGSGHVYGNTYVDEVLSLVADKSKLRFRNMIDINNVQVLRTSGAQYLVLHRLFEAQLPYLTRPHPCVSDIERRYKQAFGEPIYVDDHILVFRIEKSGAASPAPGGS